jgi:DNA-binding CsgD family transcriptional regulator
MPSALRVSQLIGRIYDAALDATSWADVLRDVLPFIGAGAGHMMIIGTRGERQNAISVNFDAAESDKYNSYYGRLDPVAPILEKSPVGCIVVCRNSLSERHRSGEFYHDWAYPNEVPDGLFVNIERCREEVCSVVLARPWLATPLGSPPALRRLELLVPHFQRSMATRRAMASSTRHPPEASMPIETHHGCVLLSNTGKVLFANEVARRLRMDEDGLVVSSQGLRARLPRENVQLQRLISAARPRGTGQVRMGDHLRVSGAMGDLKVQTIPLTSHWLGEAFPLSTLVLIIDIERTRRSHSLALQELYRLTPAETAVAVRIPGSRGLQKIADDMGLSLSTVRTHVQRIFEKTGTHRQAEVVRLLLELDRVGAGMETARKRHSVGLHSL